MFHFRVSGQNFNNTVFDDEAGTWIMVGRVPFAGSYRPYGGGEQALSSILSVFDQHDAAGVWTLEVSDGARKNQGTLNSWSLHFTGALAPAQASMAMNLESPSSVRVANGGAMLLLDTATVDQLLSERESTWTRKSRLKLIAL